MVSIPEAQYLLTVTPGTSSILRPINEMSLAIFNPCSASGMALPTMTSSILVLSKSGSSLNICSKVSAANSSGLLNLKTPLGALPQAVLYALTIYAVFISLISFLKVFLLLACVEYALGFFVPYKEIRKLLFLGLINIVR